MRTRPAWLLLVVAGCSFAPSGAAGSAVPTDGDGGSNRVGGDGGTADPAVDAAARADAPDATRDATPEATGDATRDATGDASGDASGTPALACPSGPRWFQIADSDSWYFASSNRRAWRAAELECEGLQLAGGSAVHLAVADSLVEVVELAVHDPDHDYWIGMFQPPDQATPDAGWLWLTGASGFGSASVGVWSAGEPNDDGGFSSSAGESNDENFAELHGDGATLNDAAETHFDRYLCECDGVPVPAATRALIPQ